MKKIAFLTIAVLLIVIAVFLWPDKTLTWQEETGYRWAKLKLPWTGRTGFESLIPSKTNISFSNHLSNELITSNEHLLNGSGVALGDVDRDGLTDIYLCRLDGSNALYKNLGDWEFVEITATAGVACSGQFSTGAAFADIDGDDDLDLLVTTLGGPNFCFLNQGDGTFADFTELSGLLGNAGATTMALADIDGDNDLDLYVTNYKKHTVRDLFLPQELEFDRVVKKVGDGYEVIPEFQQHYTVWQTDHGLLMRYEDAEPDRLYLNDGTGRFRQVPFDDDRFLDENGKPVP
ncbi:VCBS repeat-containing protein, partial [bacterium]|nr:VCBS repeat-containing protein [bacterium]